MKLIHTTALYIHIIIGAVMLVAFWLPVFSTKGSRFHVVSGRMFTNGMYIVAISGVLMCLLALWDPVAIRIGEAQVSPERAERIIAYSNMMSMFLLMLSLLVWLTVKHATLVLKAKANREPLRQWHHVGLTISLGLVGVIVGYYGIVQSQTLLIIFSVISILNSAETMRYIYKPEIKPREWIIEHFGNIIGAGIGVYTAFFAFGGRAYLSELLPGAWQILPWILPAVIGTALTFGLRKRYKQRYPVSE